MLLISWLGLKGKKSRDRVAAAGPLVLDALGEVTHQVDAESADRTLLEPQLEVRLRGGERIELVAVVRESKHDVIGGHACLEVDLMGSGIRERVLDDVGDDLLQRQ